MSLFVEFQDADALKSAFETLSEDGEVAMTLGDYGFSPLFGWFQDRFGGRTPCQPWDCLTKP